jgi:hypothetical protein
MCIVSGFAEEWRDGGTEVPSVKEATVERTCVFGDFLRGGAKSVDAEDVPENEALESASRVGGVWR